LSFHFKMPKFVKYGSFENESVEIALEALQNGITDLNVASPAYHLPKGILKNMRYENLFCCGK
jgi:hypothetical protein